MSQEVKLLKLKDLILWTENPRDPIDARAADQDVVDRAIEDTRSKWALPKLAREMGDHYDFSELPTVVFHRGKPVVYDGNRRIILGKLKHKLVSIDGFDIGCIPEIPAELPCNVCSRDVALRNVYRKHSDTGSWLPLERDIFLHKYMGGDKSPFLIIEENSGIVGRDPHLNQRFVKEEIFSREALAKLGIIVEADGLLSRHSMEETQAILDDLSRKIKSKDISTRKNRGLVLEVLDPPNQRLVAEHRGSKPHSIRIGEKAGKAQEPARPRQSRRVRTKGNEIFGGPLYLRMGGVSDMYRDIVDLYGFYCNEKERLSSVFPSLIRMALRLLCEAAANDARESMEKYVRSRFQKAKGTLDQDVKTTLANNNVSETSIVQLLHTGAHNYSASANLDQTLAVSLIVGAILADSHGKVAKT